MSTRVRRPKSSFKAAPEGLHPAVCVDVWDVYTENRPEQWGGGLVDKTRVVWQIDQTYIPEDGPDRGKERRYEVMMIYTASLHEKAKLRQHLESWRGRKFSEEELDDFELEVLVGKCCQIQVIHNISTGGDTFANVQAIVPYPRGMEKLGVSSDFIRRKDRKKDDDSPGSSNEPAGEDYDDDSVPF